MCCLHLPDCHKMPLPTRPFAPQETAEQTFPQQLQESLQQHQHQLLHMLRRYTLNMEDAKDLLQELWSKCLHNPGISPPQGMSAQAYLFRMARNMAIDRLRHQKLQQEYVGEQQALQQQDCATDPDKQYAQRRLLEEIDTALQVLPTRVRDVFMQSRLEGIHQRELARQHGVSIATVERDIQRASQCVEAVLERWQQANGIHGIDGAEASATARDHRRKFLRNAILGLFTLAGMGSLLRQLHILYVPQWRDQIANSQTQHMHRTLPDGSRLTLDAASAIHFAYFAQRRTATLQQGMAWFDVAKDPLRPFSVQAQGLQISVLGTRFSVDIQEPAIASGDAASIEIAVSSGLVRVQPGIDPSPWTFAPLELKAGDTLRLNPQNPAEAALRQQPLAALHQGQQGRLSFQQVPLGQITRRLQRYSPKTIHISPQAAQTRVTADIQIEQAEEWLSLLPRIMPVRVRITEDEIRIQNT
jgi:RNA polymerase sigma factor (sigma-70 family)